MSSSVFSSEAQFLSFEDFCPTAGETKSNNTNTTSHECFMDAPSETLKRGAKPRDSAARTRGLRDFETSVPCESLLLRPEDAFILVRDRPHSLVNEFLEALAPIGLSRIDVALGVRGDTVHGIE